VLPEGWQFQLLARPHDEQQADERHATARRQQRRARREREARAARAEAVQQRLLAGGWRALAAAVGALRALELASSRALLGALQFNVAGAWPAGC
jgi:hypothetical protein